MTGTNKDLDPVANIFYNRIAELRRSMAKHQGRLGLVKLILKRNQMRLESEDRTSNTSDITNWWDQNEDEDLIQNEVLGPITLIISDLASMGCTMGQDLIIKQDKEPDIDVWNMPWQHLKTAILSIPIRQRMKSTDQMRTFAGNINEIDQEMTKGLLSKMGQK